MYDPFPSSEEILFLCINNSKSMISRAGGKPNEEYTYGTVYRCVGHFSIFFFYRRDTQSPTIRTHGNLHKFLSISSQITTASSIHGWSLESNRGEQILSCRNKLDTLGYTVDLFKKKTCVIHQAQPGENLHYTGTFTFVDNCSLNRVWEPYWSGLPILRVSHDPFLNQLE